MVRGGLAGAYFHFARGCMMQDLYQYDIPTGPTVPAAASALASASGSAPGGPQVPAVVDPAANLPTPPPLPEVENMRYTYERANYEDCPETLLDTLSQ